MRAVCATFLGVAWLWGQSEKPLTYVGVAGSYLQLRLPARSTFHSHRFQPRSGWGVGAVMYRSLRRHWGWGLEMAYHRLHASSIFSVRDTVFTEQLKLQGMAFAPLLWGEIPLASSWVITASLGPQVEYFYDISYEAAEKLGLTPLQEVHVHTRTASTAQGEYPLDESPFHPVAFSAVASAGIEHHWSHHIVTGVELRLEEGLENFFTHAHYKDTHADFWATSPTHQPNLRGHALVTGLMLTMLYQLE